MEKAWKTVKRLDVLKGKNTVNMAQYLSDSKVILTTNQIMPYLDGLTFGQIKAVTERLLQEMEHSIPITLEYEQKE